MKRKDKRRTLYEEGFTDGQIAEETGYRRATVASWRWRNKLKPNKLKKRCPHCEAKFETKLPAQIWCVACSRRRRKLFLFIRLMRQQFAAVVRKNPDKAKALVEEMTREEGERFKEFVLDGVYEYVVEKETKNIDWHKQRIKRRRLEKLYPEALKEEEEE